MDKKELNRGEFLTLQEIFAGRRFRIPDYQRGYSWEEDQLKDLLEDIESVSKSDYMHYTGTIVAARDRQDEALYYIVDGQQRLTSLFILLHEIFRLCKNTIFQNYLEWLDKLFTKIDSQRFLRLNSETDDFFFKSILHNDDHTKIENKSHRNIVDAKRQFDAWIKKPQSYLDSYLDAILNKLGFLFYSTESTKEIGIMFEVINNRGKRLSQLEKIKNYLIYYSIKADFEELSKAVELYWPTLLSNLSKADKTTNEEENAFLRYCWLIFSDPKKADSYDVYKMMKHRYPVETINEEDGKSLVKFVQMMEKSSKYYADLFTSEELLMQRIGFHPVRASIMPLYLSVFHVSSEGENHRARDTLLELLEKLNFRIYVCPNITKRSDTHQAELFQLAHDFYNKRITTEELTQRLREFIEKKCPIKKFVQSLTLDTQEDYDYQDWPGLVYFLTNYEIFLNNKKTMKLSDIIKKGPQKDRRPDDRLTKEHIWGRKNREKKNNRYEDNHEKTRLGNFALLEGGINSQGDKKGIEEKLEIYRKRISDRDRVTKFEMIHELPGIHKEAEAHTNTISCIKNKNWYYRLYRKINDIRERKMINFAFHRWGINDEAERYRVEIDSDRAERERVDEVFFIVPSTVSSIET